MRNRARKHRPNLLKREMPLSAALFLSACFFIAGGALAWRLDRMIGDGAWLLLIGILMPSLWVGSFLWMRRRRTLDDGRPESGTGEAVGPTLVYGLLYLGMGFLVVLAVCGVASYRMQRMFDPYPPYMRPL